MGAPRPDCVTGMSLPVAPFDVDAATEHLHAMGAGHAPSLVEQVAEVPDDPGCYLWKDASGEVIYVGKAKNLRARLRQYVTLTDDRAKIPLMMQLVASFDYIVVESEHEALVLERELIAQYHPYFNVDYKDDKSYPYIAITRGDVFPAIKYTREKHRPDTRYYGPYTDSRAARETIDTLRKVCPICTASCAEWKRVRRLLEKRPDDADVIELICSNQGRPCFDYHVGRGPGVCAGMIGREEYAVNVRRVERFLSGQRRELVDELKADMAEAAADLDFERAGRIKRRLEVIDGLDDRQQVVFPTSVDLDLIGFYREETIAGACVFVVREGRVQRTCEFILDKGLDVDEVELASGFVKRYYDETADVPHEVDLAIELPDADVVGEVDGQEGARVPPAPPAAWREAPLAADGRAQRPSCPHALHDADGVLGRSHQSGAIAARERVGPGRAADAHRVFRHLDPAWRLHRRVHGRIYERQARQKPVPSLQDPCGVG